jgi:hypothetical protein
MWPVIIGGCRADVLVVVDLGGGDGGDVGAGDVEPEFVVAVEPLPELPARRAVLGGEGRTIVQSSPEVITIWLMPASSSYARRRNVLAMNVESRVCQVGYGGAIRRYGR